MKKTKIVHVLHSVGGVDVSLRLILKNTNASEFESIVIHGSNDTNQLFYNKNGDVITEYKLPIAREISFVEDVMSILRTYSIIRKEKPAIIHAHSSKGGIIARVAGIMTGVKVLYTPQAFSFLSSPNKTKRVFFLWIEKIFSKGNTILLASSASEMKRGILEVGFNTKKAILFNNAIEPIAEVIPLSIEKKWPDHYICSVGRPCFQKNIIEMVYVIRELTQIKTDVHLVLMGVGHHSDQLEEVRVLIQKFNLSDKITLLDWTSRSDVLHIISKSQLYISTARYEGLPYSIIESLALGIPCVVSDCDGNKDLIVDGKNGFVIADNNTTLFTEKVMALLSNKDLLKQFSENAYQSFSENYNICKNIKELESIYLKYSVKIK